MGRIFINKHFPILKAGVEKKEERTIMGVVLEPNTFDAQGHMISEEEIRKAAFKFMEEHGTWGGNWKVEHSASANWDVALLQSYLAPADITLEGSDGEEQTILKGSWVMSHRIYSDELWKKIKDGDITGYSIGGQATHHDIQKSIAKSAKQDVKKMAGDDEGDEDQKELTDLNVNEVSLVSQGANKKRYLIIKNEQGFDGSTTEGLINSVELLNTSLERVIRIAKSDQGGDEEVRDIIEGIGQTLCMVAKGDTSEDQGVDSDDDEIDVETDETEIEADDGDDDVEADDTDDGDDDVDGDDDAEDGVGGDGAEDDHETLTTEDIAKMITAEVARVTKANQAKPVAKSKGNKAKAKKKAKATKPAKRTIVVKSKKKTKKSTKRKSEAPARGDVLKNFSERLAKLEHSVGTPNSQPPGEDTRPPRHSSDDDWPVDFNQQADADISF